MNLGIVLASTTSPSAKPSPSSGQGLSATSIGVLIGVVALLLLSLAVIVWIASRGWRHRRRYRRGNPPRRPSRRGSPQGPGVSLAVRSAFARGDYMAVIELAMPDVPAPIKLLLAQSYGQIGADVLAADTAFEAIKAILTGSDWSAAKAMKGFSALEARALRSWLNRFDGIEQGFDQVRLTDLRKSILAPAPETPEESVQLSSELDEIRQRVTAERRTEKNTTNGYRLVNLIAGTLAGGLAATSGVFGVTNGSPTVIASLAFVSAAITTVLTTLKPAERERESKVRADALGQLTAAIDLFDIDRSDDAVSLLPAIKAVHERLAIAEGRGTIIPLVASSKLTAGAAITAINPTEGPTTGGQDLTITGTGFTGATSVRFGNKNASNHQVESDTQITATTPAHAAGSVKVTVAGPDGKSPDHALARYTYSATLQSPP